MVRKKVFISAPSNRWLDERRRLLKAAILKKILDQHFEPQEFFESGVPENLSWSFESVDRVMKQCAGAVVMGFPRWTVRESDSETRLIGEYNHYEGAVALTHRLPVLILAEGGVQNRGIVWTGGGKTITYVPENADAGWVETADFLKRFKSWCREIESRNDVFLGYCSKSAGTAAQIQLRLEKLGVSVKNWAMDFKSGVSILTEIDNARMNCTCGIFLFSEDDPLEGKNGAAAPRDNVVFEAGYFMSSKGAEKCLIIREGEAKMPADLGGAIYLHLKKGEDVATIEGRLANFVDQNWSSATF